MTITRINDNTLMLEINDEEISKTNEEEFLYHILNVAVISENLNTKNCAFLLEGVESTKGIVFLLTIKNIRRTFKIKKENNFFVYEFTCLEDFLNCITALYKSKYKIPDSSTYIMDDCYYICFDSHLFTPAKVLITQYGKQCGCNSIIMGKLREYGKTLTHRNSVEFIGNSFTCKDF